MFPNILRRLFQNAGAGPLLNPDILPGAGAATATANGSAAGITTLAASNNTAALNLAATPAGVAAQITARAATQAETTAGTVENKYVSPATLKAVLPDSYSTYSTTETWTGGYWIDGKKIYRRTWTGLNAILTPTWVNLVAAPTNLSQIIACVLRLRGANAFFPCHLYKEGSYIQAAVPVTEGAATTAVCIEYTCSDR